MDIWKILEIEPTTDQSEIKKAYLTKLKVTHPEEKPEEFAQLKQAYELAKQYKEGDIKEKSQFIKDLEQVYFNFKDRLDIQNWKNLFNKYVNKNDSSLESLAEDKSDIIREELLTFLMNDFYINTETWKLIDNTFNVSFHKDALYLKFPHGFIDFVLSRFTYGEVFDLKSIEIDENRDCRDYDLFITKSQSLSNYARNNNYDNDNECLKEVFKQLEEIDKFNINNVHNDIIKVRARIVLEGIEKGEELFLELLEKYPQGIDNATVKKALGVFYYQNSKWAQALPLFEEIEEIFSDDATIILYLGMLYYYNAKYEEAKKYLYSCFVHPELKQYENGVRGLIFETNKNLIDVYIKKNELSNYSDFEDLKELGSCYHNINEYEKAYEILIKTNVEDRNVNFYDLFLAVITLTKRYELFEEIYSEYKNSLEPDQEEDKSITKARAFYYKETKQYQKSIDICNEMITNIDDEINLAFIKIEALKAIDNNKEIIDIARNMRSNGRVSFKISLVASKILSENNYFEEAFEFAKIANSINSYDSDLQQVMMECLQDFKEFEKVIQIYEFAVNNNLNNSVCDVIGAFAYGALENFEKAYSLVETGIEGISKESRAWAVGTKAKLYVLDNKLDKAIEVLETELKALDEINIVMVLDLSNYYRKNKQVDKALKLCYKHVFGKEDVEFAELEAVEYKDVADSISQRHYYTLIQFIARLEYEENSDFKKAIILFEKSYEFSEFDFIHTNYYLGHCYAVAKDYEKSIYYFKKSIGQNLDIDYSLEYRRLLSIYEKLGDKENIFNICEEAYHAYPTNEAFFNKYIDLLGESQRYEQCIEIGTKLLENSEVKKLNKVFSELCSYLFLTGKQDKIFDYIKIITDRLENDELEENIYLYEELANIYIELYTVNDLYKFTDNKEEYLNKAVLYSQKSVDYINERVDGDFSKIKHNEQYTVGRLINCYYLLGSDAMVKKYKKSLEIYLNTDIDDCYSYAYSKMYYLSGEYKKAIKYANKASNLNVKLDFCSSAPVCKHSYEVLGEIYFADKQYEKAIENFEKYLSYEFSAYIVKYIEFSKMYLELKKNN